MAGRLWTFGLLSMLAATASSFYPRLAIAAVTSSGDTTIGSSITVGNTTLGTYRIDGGSAATTSSMTIGQQTGGLGLVTITGPGSSLAFTSSSGLTVGNSGFAQMEISNGAVVNLGSFGQLRISQNESSFGTLTVDGTGTLLQVGGSMTVGGSNSLGDALLRISNGAIVNSTNNTLTINAIGRLELERWSVARQSVRQRRARLWEWRADDTCIIHCL
jgi:T5SS/PEP-CTERM-associated repeat protein